MPPTADRPPADPTDGDDDMIARLPATAWAVLGILSFGEELTGYEVRQWADHSLRFFYWSPAMSQIYSELKRLEQVGYATSRTVTGDDTRTKRVYTITGAGRAALSRWVEDAPVEPPVLKHGAALRVWLGHLATPQRLREIVSQHRDNAQRLHDEAECSRQSAADLPGWVYPELVARWAARYYAAERDLAEQMLTDLDELC
ncbi:PadR family transcriptional regulator [Spirillospora sp. NPDC048911]|uniref:PadR family transcriptional regulator n=1 Tax=Spirillospora sp. NPDC048911 TaxID=3364527 RepID=UPI0037144839